MKCTKCGFTNLDYADLCSKCNYDLTETKKLLGLTVVKPRRVSFLSQLLRPIAESRKDQAEFSTSPGITLSLEDDITLPLTEPAEEPPEFSPFELSQIDLSDLEDEVTPETKPTELESKSTATPEADTDRPLSGIDEINLDELFESDKTPIQLEEILDEESLKENSYSRTTSEEDK